jgi:hypothetical protein
MLPRQRLVPFALAAAAAVAVLLGGCSSGSDGTAAAVSPGTSSTAQVATSSAADTRSTGSVAGTADTTGSTADTSGSVAGTFSNAARTSGSKVFAEPAECASIAQKYGSVSSAMMPVLQGRTGPTPFDAEALVAAVDAGTMGTIPAEVAPDFAAFKTAGEQLRGKDLTAAATVLDGPDMSKAALHIEKFLSDHC